MHAIFDSSQNRLQLGRERCDGWISVKGFKWVYVPLPQKTSSGQAAHTLVNCAIHNDIFFERTSKWSHEKKMRDMLSIIDLWKHIQPI